METRQLTALQVKSEKNECMMFLFPFKAKISTFLDILHKATILNVFLNETDSKVEVNLGNWSELCCIHEHQNHFYVNWCPMNL